MDLNVAIQAHSEWKMKLRAAITRKEKIEANLSVDNACALGKWLHGEAKAPYSKFPAYADLVTKHAAFHREAGKVATAIAAGKYPEAEALLEAGTGFATASAAVGVAIIKLKKDAGL
jgi:methyl-accepting chemotaxis protein